MQLGIKGRTALVTASSRGLGKACAEALAQEGARVIVNGRSKLELESLVGNLYGVGHDFCMADLTTSQGVDELLNFVQQKNYAIDILVHNLGGNLGVTDVFCSLEDWHSVMRINVDVAIQLNRFLIPQMQERKWGRVCHVSSISALENQGPPAYCAAKAALVAYARSMGRYVAKDNVVVNTILPGAVMTEGGYWDDAVKFRPEHVKKFMNDRMAIGRFGTPEEIGNVVAFLCSDLSSFCVGSAFVIDGGQGKVFYAQDQ